MVLSEEETKGIRKREYAGLTIYEIAKHMIPVEATVSYGDKRLVFEGIFCIDRTEKSWKFGDQTQLVLYSRELPRLENRARNDNYARIEIALPTPVAAKMLEVALKKLWLLPEELEK